MDQKVKTFRNLRPDAGSIIAMSRAVREMVATQRVHRELQRALLVEWEHQGLCLLLAAFTEWQGADYDHSLTEWRSVPISEACGCR
jgi:hypothetical protein